MNKKQGFTLIELLVVIAIIGILSGIVLTSLNTARGKAKDAAIKSQLASLRSQAEIFYDSSSGSYGTAGASCATIGSVFADLQATALITRINADNGTNTDTTCDNTTTAWAAQAQLASNTRFYCVDSRGTAVENATAFTITDQECD